MKLILAILLLFLFHSCNIFTSPLEQFYIELENKIDKEKLLNFKNSPKDSVINYFWSFSEFFLEVYEDSMFTKEINDFVDSMKFEPRDRALILVYSFHSKLNNEKIQNNLIVTEHIQNFFNNIENEEKIEDEKEFLEVLKIVQDNDKKWSIGDTLNLIFPLETNKKNGEKLGFLHVYPLTLNCSGSDSLIVQGTLLDKYYENYQVDILNDSIGLVFKIKLIEFSDTSARIFWNRFNVGDEFEIDLRGYGRPIE